VRGFTICAGLLLLGSACSRSPASLLPDARVASPSESQRPPRSGDFPVIGHVSDAGSGYPLGDVYLAVDRAPIASTDGNGYYQIIPSRWWPRGRHEIWAGRRGYRAFRDSVTFREGSTLELDIRLERAPRPCCRLTGGWSAEFTLDSAGALAPNPSARFVRGSLFFSDTLRSPDPHWPPSDSTLILTTLGQFAVDFSPFFGSAVARDVSTTVVGPTDEAFFHELTGEVFASDSVEVDFIPRISHGGVSIVGRWIGDSIVGRWEQRAYCCGAYGGVVLRRIRTP
jgi:hypothetical protein